MSVVTVLNPDAVFNDTLADTLLKRGIRITSCQDFEQLCEVSKRLSPLAAIVNLSQLSSGGGTAVRRLKQLSPNTAILALGESERRSLLRGAMDLFREGASDYMVKPIAVDQLVKIIEQSRVRKPTRWNGSAKILAHDSQLVGQCDAMKSLYAQILQVGRLEKASGLVRTVLITGETGTGKQLVARALHLTGTRLQGPFIEINCAAIPATLLEAELFGFEKGAFTDAKAAKPGLFEQADSGTLFLDEICSMEMSVQTKLLKVIEDKLVRRIGGLRPRPVDVRIIAASNKTSMAEICQSLRPDIYYRLASFVLAIPPLRDRGEDILTLARFFLGRIAQQYGGPVKRLTSEAEQALIGYQWPGNVRELMHVMERAALQGVSEIIRAEELNLVAPSTQPVVKIHRGGRVVVEFGEQGIDLEHVERQLIGKALVRANWNRAEAARLLGISKETLRYRIDKFDLSQSSMPKLNGEDEFTDLSAASLLN